MTESMRELILNITGNLQKFFTMQCGVKFTLIGYILIACIFTSMCQTL